MAVNNPALIASHYAKCWGVNGQPKHWMAGPTWKLPPAFQVLVFPPFQQRRIWIYGTCGMSQESDAAAIELHLLSPIETDSHVELLTAIAHYHWNGAHLGLNHTVNFGRPWLPGKWLRHWLRWPGFGP